MQNKIFLEIAIRTTGERRDVLVSVMSELGCGGFMETDEVLFCYIEKDRWTDSQNERLTDIIRSLFPALSTNLPVSTREIVEENWNEQWERTIQPVEIGERMVVVPTWSTYKNIHDRIILHIDPKMSFGTGHHETTRLTLKLLERYISHGHHMLDVGTGSGILAIAAVKLGASHATGIDIDPWSIENAKENIALNHVEQFVEISQEQPEEIKHRAYNLIASNLTLNANIDLLHEYRRLLLNGGMLLLSGFLKTDLSEMEQHLNENRFVVRDVVTENEWSAIGAAKSE